MIEIDFESFHNLDYVEEGYDLYVMKYGNGDILYIGISARGVWERWFGFGGHMVWAGNVIYGTSAVGQKIEDHLPDSLKWKIQLWTLEDCIEFCKSELPQTRRSLTIKFIEPVMIQKLAPILNVSNNLHPGKDAMPESEREKKREEELDDLYNKIFNKE